MDPEVFFCSVGVSLCVFCVCPCSVPGVAGGRCWRGGQLDPGLGPLPAMGAWQSRTRGHDPGVRLPRLGRPLSGGTRQAQRGLSEREGGHQTAQRHAQHQAPPASPASPAPPAPPALPALWHPPDPQGEEGELNNIYGGLGSVCFTLLIKPHIPKLFSV